MALPHGLVEEAASSILAALEDMAFCFGVSTIIDQRIKSEYDVPRIHWR